MASHRHAGFAFDTAMRTESFQWKSFLELFPFQLKMIYNEKFRKITRNIL